jgi:hypothetical protein
MGLPDGLAATMFEQMQREVMVGDRGWPHAGITCKIDQCTLFYMFVYPVIDHPAIVSRLAGAFAVGPWGSAAPSDWLDLLLRQLVLFPAARTRFG